ncbi:MAG: RNB domain-containing ribonuclease [bacterium]|nr:RNB domain-containing ribonuclease [bacterium]
MSPRRRPGGHSPRKIKRLPAGFRPESVEKERAVGVEGICEEFELPSPFTRAVLREAGRVAEMDVTGKAGRLDLSHLTTITIDPADARDHDDAVSLELLPDGTRRLGVHIADVAEYVREGTALDREAFLRGNSTYFYLDTIPMLPEILSGAMCSLNDRDLRPAVSVLIDYDRQGRVLKTTFAETLVVVDRGLSYVEAERVLSGGDDDLAGLLGEMAKLANELIRRRRDDGSLHFELPEIVPIDHGDGVEAFRPSPILESHRLVEEFMLAANHEVGRLLRDQGVPHLVRVHEPPDPDDVEELVLQMMRQKVNWRPSGQISSHDYQQLAVQIMKREGSGRLLFKLLRSMKKACYSVPDHGHFGLGWFNYLHFTSPIRRYADLMVHRLLKDLISARAVDDGGIRSLTHSPGGTERIRKPAKDRRDYSELFRHGGRHRRRGLRDVASAINEREILSLKAEREALKLEMVLWARNHMGESCAAVVLEVLPTGLVLQLPESGVEGYIPAQYLGDEYFAWREEREELRGERTGKVFAAQMKLVVRIVNANLFSRRTQFLLEEDGQANETTDS